MNRWSHRSNISLCCRFSIIHKHKYMFMHTWIQRTQQQTYTHLHLRTESNTVCVVRWPTVIYWLIRSFTSSLYLFILLLFLSFFHIAVFCCSALTVATTAEICLSFMFSFLISFHFVSYSSLSTLFHSIHFFFRFVLECQYEICRFFVSHHSNFICRLYIFYSMLNKIKHFDFYFLLQFSNTKNQMNYFVFKYD